MLFRCLAIDSLPKALYPYPSIPVHFGRQSARGCRTLVACAPPIDPGKVTLLKDEAASQLFQPNFHLLQARQSNPAQGRSRVTGLPSQERQRGQVTIVE